jgi:hypothetical protein
MIPYQRETESGAGRRASHRDDNWSLEVRHGSPPRGESRA